MASDIANIIGVVARAALCVIYGVWCFCRGVKFGEKSAISVIESKGEEV